MYGRYGTATIPIKVLLWVIFIGFTKEWSNVYHLEISAQIVHGGFFDDATTFWCHRGNPLTIPPSRAHDRGVPIFNEAYHPMMP